MSNLVSVRVTIRHFEAAEQQAAALGDEILKAAVGLAGQTALRDTDAEVELVEGSLRVKAGLVGALMAAYGVVADYKGFKESVAEIAQDTRLFATAIREAIPQIVNEKQGMAPQDVRGGKISVTAEELSMFIEQLEKLKDNSRTMSEEQLSIELEKIARRFRFLKRQLDHKDMATVEKNMAQLDLPAPTRWPTSPTPRHEREIIRPDSFEDLRRRIESREFDRISAKSAPDSKAAPALRRRRIYFKRAAVRSSADNPKLL
ncbi:MAG: hypothetical protein Q8N31_04685 [Reyranella sp.]|nr:hypothetical protein [Reyranella sp.]MDP3159288.1 hypothetical protein [Reyranella sp.]